MATRVRVTHRIHPQVLVDIQQSEGLRRNMLRRGIRVQTAARDRLGHDPRRIDTGRLRASIAVSEVLTDTWIIRVGTSVEYAIFVHEGTRFMRANPFLRDALPAAARS